MTTYAICDTTGRILYTTESNAAPAALSAGQTALQVPDGAIVGFETHMVSGDQLVPFVPALADVQIAKRAAAASYFSNLFLAPAVFSYGGNPYQIDPASQVAISGLAQAAAANIANADSVPLPAYWIDAANNRQTMTAGQYYAFAVAVGSYVSACRLRFRAIKDAILAAGTVADVQAIDVTAGYPAAGA